MITLHLRLKNKQFKMAESGELTEVYRTIKPYWIKQLCFAGRTKECTEKQSQCRECFRLASQFGGYMCYPYTHAWIRMGRTDRFIVKEIEDICYGYGKPELGAPEGIPVFIIKFKKGGNK